MNKITASERKQLQVLGSQLKQLQKELILAKRAEGIDDYLGVKGAGTKLRFASTRVENGPDKAVGEFHLRIALTAKAATLYLPLSVSSGKTVTGFMYQIEGTGEASVASAAIELRTRGLTAVQTGTLRYLVIPKGRTVELDLIVTLRGKVGRSYRIVVSRINYKLATSDARYQQYQKSLPSKSLRFA